MSDKVYITPRYYVFASDGESGSMSTDSFSPDGDPESKDKSVVKSTTSSDTSYQDLIDQVTLTNHLLVGIILFIGVFFGAFCMGHLYNRIRRD